MDWPVLPRSARRYSSGVVWNIERKALKKARLSPAAVCSMTASIVRSVVRNNRAAFSSLFRRSTLANGDPYVRATKRRTILVLALIEAMNSDARGTERLR